MVRIPILRADDGQRDGQSDREAGKIIARRAKNMLDNMRNKVYITVIMIKIPFMVDNPVNSGVQKLRYLFLLDKRWGRA